MQRATTSHQCVTSWGWLTGLTKCFCAVNQSTHFTILCVGSPFVCIWIWWVWKIFFFFWLVNIYCFLLQRSEVLMRVHKPLPPNNKYLSTKPIDTVDSRYALRSVVNYALWMFLNPPISSPSQPLTLQYAAHSLVSPKGEVNPLRDWVWALDQLEEEIHSTIQFLDQPSSALPGVVFQL